MVVHEPPRMADIDALTKFVVQNAVLLADRCLNDVINSQHQLVNAGQSQEYKSKQKASGSTIGEQFMTRVRWKSNMLQALT